MNLAAVAAFTAAALSLVNVVVTSHLTRRGQKEQWRRETERPIVAAVLAASDECREKWVEAAACKEEWIRTLTPDGPRDNEEQRKMTEAYAEGRALYDKLRLRLAELDLVAGTEVRLVAAELDGKHASVRHIIRPAGGADNPSSVAWEYGIEIETLRTAVISAARVDIGVDTGGITGKWRTRRAVRASGHSPTT